MTALPPDLIENEYAVTVKVRNNYLLKRMKAAGYETAAELARAIGISNGTIGDLLNFKMSGFKKNDEWRGTVIRVSDHLRCMPEDIIPPLHRSTALAKNTSEFEATAEEVAQIVQSEMSIPANPEIELRRLEAANIINSNLGDLTPRAERVIRMRFGLDGQEAMTYDQIGEKFGITKERIRQIELKAFRLLKAPGAITDSGIRRKQLKELAEDKEIWS